MVDAIIALSSGTRFAVVYGSEDGVVNNETESGVET